MGFFTAAIISTSAVINMGIMSGHHLINSYLNNTHPYIEYEQENYGFGLFYNSFERVSAAAYLRQEFKSDNLSFSLRYGLTTGYNKLNIYKDRIYEIDNTFMVSDGLMVLIVPELKYKFDSDYYIDSTILGDSISVGLGYSF